MVLDFLLVAMGTRQLLTGVFSGLLMHPPLAVAAQQALHVLLTGSARDYCRRVACRTLLWGCCFAVHAVHAARCGRPWAGRRSLRKASLTATCGALH